MTGAISRDPDRGRRGDTRAVADDADPDHADGGASISRAASNGGRPNSGRRASRG